jgi:hypothetical protein
VAIRQKGHPLIRHCRIRNGKAYGVHVSEKGGGWLRNATYHSMPWDHGISSRGAGRAAREIGLD